MKTLYVSDLDGTLLQSDERTSEYTNATINHLVERGMLFSYATARSFETSRKAATGLNVNIPLIVYNGAMIVNNEDGSFLLKNFFGKEAAALLKDLFYNDVFPIVYSFIDGKEVFSFITSKCTVGMKMFIHSRKGDKRTHIQKTIYSKAIFFITKRSEVIKTAM